MIGIANNQVIMFFKIAIFLNKRYENTIPLLSNLIVYLSIFTTIIIIIFDALIGMCIFKIQFIMHKIIKKILFV